MNRSNNQLTLGNITLLGKNGRSMQYENIMLLSLY